MQDGKTFHPYRTACLLLAQRDYEQIPVAHFTQRAETFGDAFHERFSAKDAFPAAAVDEMMRNLHGYRAGVVRAALKPG